MKSTLERVSDWNERAGKIPAEKGTDAYWKALKQQIERIQEELNETLEAVENKDLVELLDGCGDLDVTVSGLIFLADLPYKEAISKILDNNDTKITTDFDVAWDTQNHYEGLQSPIKCYIVTVTVDDVTWYSVHREFDDKIMKLINHSRVELEV